MEKTINKNVRVFFKNALSVCLCVLCAIILPQLFHAFGVLTGTGGNFGQLFLPMYLPVLILALRSNAVLGAVAGVLSPIISFALSGMPTVSMLPFISLELVCFGLFAGLLADKQWNVFAKIFTVQLLSRGIRIITALLAIYFIRNTALTVVSVLNTTIAAIPGFILQLLVVPYFMDKGRF